MSRAYYSEMAAVRRFLLTFPRFAGASAVAISDCNSRRGADNAAALQRRSCAISSASP